MRKRTICAAAAVYLAAAANGFAMEDTSVPGLVFEARYVPAANMIFVTARVDVAKAGNDFSAVFYTCDYLDASGARVVTANTTLFRYSELQPENGFIKLQSQTQPQFRIADIRCRPTGIGKPAGK